MRVLLLCHAFNGLCQRVFVELEGLGATPSVELDIHDDLTAEAVDLLQPDLVLAPYLKRAIPEAVWGRVPTIVIHPGVVGDRGPSALDRAILDGEATWGATALQANAEMDAGDVWAAETFAMRQASKGSLYRQEVTEAAARLCRAIVAGAGDPGFRPRPVDPLPPLRPLVRQAERGIDWARDGVDDVVRKIRSADGAPGLLDRIEDDEVLLFGAHPERSHGGPPGALLAQRHGAVLRGCRDGAVWISHLRRRGGASPGAPLKLPAARVLGARAERLPHLDVGLAREEGTYQDLWYEEDGDVGFLHFDVYNGALHTGACRRILDAYREAARRPTRVIVLMGGHDFFANGIDLCAIEDAPSAADESMRNIEAIDDVAREILLTTSHLTVSAVGGNAAAGGAFLALAADRVLCRRGVVWSPHYKNMGNLHGSEYWTYVLPRRVGRERVARVMGRRLPMGADEARALGMVDEVIEGDVRGFRAAVKERARALATEAPGQLAEKRARRARDEADKPLARYREEELERMRRNFYGFDPSYHVARYNFVFRVPHSRTPLHLARHRAR